MDEEQKKQVAVFRFGVIADFVTGARLSRTERRRLLVEKCARKWVIPFSPRIGQSTLRDWIRCYEAGGRRLEALYPKDRSDSGKSRRIDEETTANLTSCAGRWLKLLSPRSSKPCTSASSSPPVSHWLRQAYGAYLHVMV